MKIVNSMEIRKLIIKNSGFSLIEFLVGVLIFSIVFGMTIISVKLASGKVASNQNKTVSIELRNAIETINQKMNNANTHIEIGNFLPPAPASAPLEIYGFYRVDNSNSDQTRRNLDNVLAIVTSNNQDDPTQPQYTCAFIAVINVRLYMHENQCNSVQAITPDNSSPLTSDKIKVTGFLDSGYYNMTDENRAQAPYVNLKIEAQDAKDDKINFTYQTSFTMDYLTFKKLKQV